MKRTGILISFLWIFFSVLGQEEGQIICRLGFTFEISQQQSWGYNKPVILSVAPSSPAFSAGLLVNDIIEEIDGIKTKGNSIAANNQIIQNAGDNVKLVISNYYGKKEIELNKDCKLSNAINESQLSEAYAFYSLEDACIRTFTCPFKTILHSNVDLLNYHSFGFSEIDPSNQKLETLIYQQIRHCLEEKGLVYDEKNPDLIVNTYYSYNKNLNYNKSPNTDKFPVESRYNIMTQKMESLPIYYNPLINQRQAEFLLNLGIRLIDRKQANANNLFVVWECEANELLQSNYTLDNYAKFHIPLMFMQYPYPKTLEIAKFKYKKIKYNYTGLSYNINNLKQIADVDPHSPGYQEQMRPGDIVEKINGVKTTNDTKVASDAYKQFIYRTMSLRDPKTQYTNAEGFTKCMFWDAFKYPKINEEFRKPEFYTSLSYLFYFEPYINNLSGTNVLTFEIKRENSRFDVQIAPNIRIEELFETY